MKSTVFLIGFSGAGKTYYAQKLADHLGYSFLDSDQEIEKIERMPISELFEKNGEPFFRTKEQEWVNIVSTDKTVVSVGGGLPCYNNLLETLKKKGLVIYLKARPEYLYKNITEDSKNTRPLLNNKTNLLQYIEQLLIERSVYYTQAHFVLDVESTSFWSTLLELMHEVRE